MTGRWPGGAPYAFALTFDLDRVRPTYHRLLRRLPRNAFWNFDTIHRVLDRWSLPATLFVLDQSNPVPLLMRGRLPDAFGVFPLEMVAKPLRDLRFRGVEIGIHGNWGTSRDSEALLLQRRRLAKALEVPLEAIRGNRQHYLDHRGAETFAAEAAAGLAYDASVGGNDSNLLANGDGVPWRVDAGILEIPLAAMDTALAWEARRSGQNPWDLAKSLLAKTRESGGLFTICHHPHNFRPGEISYEIGIRLLEAAARDGAWFGSLSSVAERF